MIKTSEFYDFRSHKMHKSWRRGESSHLLKIYTFPSDVALYAVAALNCYIERTTIWKEKNQTFQSLVSFVKPLNEVGKFGGWVKQILIMSDINTDIFETYAARSASSSHASLSGLSLIDILRKRSFSNKTT